LSDSEKRRKYDLLGPERSSTLRGSHRSQDDYIRTQFASEVTPEELFEMFFNQGPRSRLLSFTPFHFFLSLLFFFSFLSNKVHSCPFLRSQYSFSNLYFRGPQNKSPSKQRRFRRNQLGRPTSTSPFFASTSFLPFLIFSCGASLQLKKSESLHHGKIFNLESCPLLCQALI